MDPTAKAPDAACVFSAPASPDAGEFAQEMEETGQKEQSGNPLRVIGEGFKTLAGNVVASFKNPASLIPAGVIALLWVVLTVLVALGVRSAPTDVLSFLSFAGAGTGGGIVKTIGGILGKGVFVAAVYRVIGLFRKKEKGEKHTLGETLRGAFGFSLSDLWSWTLGLGFGLIGLAFLSGGLQRFSIVGGIAAAFLAARSALNGGFLTRLTGSFSKLLGGRGDGGGFVRGLAAGFAAGGLFSLLGIPVAVMIAGAVLIAGSIVMKVLARFGVAVPGGKKEEGK
ncbi:MAG: hypothetical protein II719_03685 [Clostridia bacterium]|nr:hypothetical protein [Clostridia bacterium]